MGDVKSAFAFVALTAIPAVAISIAPTRRFMLAAMAVTAVGAATLVSNASSISDDSSLQIETANAEVRPGEPIIACDVPHESSVELEFVYVEVHPGGTAVGCDMPEEDVGEWYKC